MLMFELKSFYRALSALVLMLSAPGPAAQAIVNRADGAQHVQKNQVRCADGFSYIRNKFERTKSRE